MKKEITKFVRFIKIYGVLRSVIKAASRLKKLQLKYILLVNIVRKKSTSQVSLIGCGQFGFSTISYFLTRSYRSILLDCFDIDEERASFTSKFFGFRKASSHNDLISNPRCKLIYIASNHFSHTNYAIQSLEANKRVYVEKPISVSFEQLDSLIEAISNSNEDSFFAGYNRPYSKAIQAIRSKVLSKSIDTGKFSLNCFISAHNIPEDHWYRNLEEGTRICGNVGHWLDLMIHMYYWRGYIPKRYKVQIAYSNEEEPDDNIIVCITTPKGDITSITITARTEPFEGINETINFQYDTIIAKIDDFRKLTIWDCEKLYKKKYRPKDVGHKRSVMQPFEQDNRELNEVIASTELMLHITDMVKNTETEKEVELIRSL